MASAAVKSSAVQSAVHAIVEKSTLNKMSAAGKTATAVAKTAASSNARRNKISQWSLNSLIRMKQEMVDPTNTARVFLPTARELVQDVALRLDQQKYNVEQMEQFVHGLNHPYEHHHADNNNDKKVIDTCTEPFWWKQADHKDTPQDRERQTHLEKAEKNLHDLKVLHENTYGIAQTLFAHLDEKFTAASSTSTGAGSSSSTAIVNSQTGASSSEYLDKKETKWIKAALRQIRDRHAMTVENLAEFVITTRPYWNSLSTKTEKEIEDFMDGLVMDFLRGRFGIQLLCEHYLSPYPNASLVDNNNKVLGGSGIVCVECALQTVLEDAISEARILCESHYSHLNTAAPEVVVVVDENSNLNFTIVRPWVHYVLVELLKNAMAKSMERMMEENAIEYLDNDDSDSSSSNMGSNVLPPTIYISIHNEDDHEHDHNDTSDKSKGPTYLSIDVMDQGGGFANNPVLAKSTDILFEFVKTKKHMWDRLDEQQTYATVRSPMQGLGVGLCLSRLAMQHFGGTVELKQHPPLSLENQAALRMTMGGSVVVGDLNAGCVASIKLVKDLDHPEHLFASDDHKWRYAIIYNN